MGFIGRVCMPNIKFQSHLTQNLWPVLKNFWSGTNREYQTSITNILQNTIRIDTSFETLEIENLLFDFSKY